MLSLLSAVIWVDFLVIALSKQVSLGKSLDKWYADFGITAVISDCLIIVLGITIAKWIVPHADTWMLILVAVAIQLLHDVLFFYLVIKPLPLGTNRMIDVFKSYSAENSWKVLVADSAMVAGTIFLSDVLLEHSVTIQSFVGLLGLYATTFVIYTKNV
jgi:hypothetical protein